MKKFTIFLLILLCLSFNIFTLTPTAATRSLKEGFYKVTDLNLSPNNVYTIQNVSFSDRIYVLIFDEGQTVLQSIRLKPQSLKYNLLPLEPNFSIVIVGLGEAIIS